MPGHCWGRHTAPHQICPTRDGTVEPGAGLGALSGGEEFPNCFQGGGRIYVVVLFFLLVAKNNLISLAFEATRGVNSILIWMCVSA